MDDNYRVDIQLRNVLISTLLSGGALNLLLAVCSSLAACRNALTQLHWYYGSRVCNQYHYVSPERQCESANRRLSVRSGGSVTCDTNEHLRTVTKIDFATANLTFSGLKACDGSFYLMDTPGMQHLPGHLTALARVTPASFIVLGGDTYHHAGAARPRPAFQRAFPCPAHLLE
ncbi:hypothetical protein GGX14DRAFT_566312 [Mycena pura]|uniref:Uncharacterized protein n=1 Tax=Mycena pura TaxID=153505 RepID=A0AAD6VJW5_9AGAR|nr:hypothetical protein GGX14DRAFT_566312 [Mycena pura]